MKDTLTDLTIILDRSGSMEIIRESMESGLEGFIAEQRAVPGECNFTLVQFDDVYEVVVEAKPIASVDTKFRLIPRGWTALYDAVGKAITAAGERLKAIPEAERPGKVVMVIITDGHENASKEYSAARVRGMIDHQESQYNWQFIFLGANFDAIAAAGNIGISPARAMNFAYTGQGAMHVNSNVSAKVAAARMATNDNDYKTSLDFDAGDRAAQDALGAQNFKK